MEQTNINISIKEELSSILDNHENSGSEVHNAKLAILQEFLVSLSGGFQHFKSLGVWVDINAHLNINRAVLKTAACYFQIQSNLELGPRIWTPQWRDFLSELSSLNIAKRYIFAGKKNEYDANIENIMEAKRELHNYGFYVGYCPMDKYLSDKRHIFYSNAVVEFFGRDLVKILLPSKDRYVGTERAILILTDQETDEECNYFMNYIDQHEEEIV